MESFARGGVDKFEELTGPKASHNFSHVWPKTATLGSAQAGILPRRGGIPCAEEPPHLRGAALSGLRRAAQQEEDSG